MAKDCKTANVPLDTPTEERALLDGLFARVPEAIVLLDTEDRILQINPEFTRVFGYVQDEACGRLINDLIVPEEHLAEAEEYTRRGLRGEDLNVETVRKHKDGARVHVSMISGPVSIAGSQVSEYVIYRDITDRKRAEQRVRESEAFLEEAQRLSRTGSFSWHVDTDEIIWSEQLYRIFELDDHLPVTIERICSRVHPDDLPLLQDKMERARQAVSDFEYQHRLLMPGQSVKHVHLFAHATRDKEGRLVYVGAAQDVTRQRFAEEQLREREFNLRQITKTIPGMLWSATPEGAVDYCSDLWLDFTSMTTAQAQGWGWTEAIHSNDVQELVQHWKSCVTSGAPIEAEARIRRFDGAYRWFLLRANPLQDESGKIVKWYGTNIDIEDRKRVEENVRASELSWRQIVDNIPGLVATMGALGEVEFLNRQTLEYFGKTTEELKNWSLIGSVHPDDLPQVIEARKKSLEAATIYEIEHRCRRADGVYRWFQVRGFPVRDAQGTITAWYFLLTDIDDRKRAEQKLQQSEQELRTITDAIANPIVVLAPDSTTLSVNRVALDLTGLTMNEVNDQGFFRRVFHPDDIDRFRAEREERLLSEAPFELEMRARHKTGEYCWYLIQYNPLKDESGQTIRWYATATNIDDRKRAEEKLRRSEEDLRTITDTIRQPIVVLAPDGTMLYANRVALDNSGLTMDEVKGRGFLVRACHPDDVDRVLHERNLGLSKGTPFDSEMRVLFKGGQYRWQLLQYNPLKDESGHIIRWYATATDIDDRKRKEERLHNENLVLREEIDRASMFEEIVGSSKPMSQLLKKVEKVAPSDSTVLILGETGTGKELIARALHRRSRRASRAFVKVNCAAIPQSLIASELFGHEKGAFTGALQRRVGRFEAANGGTLFLDEIGDLPMETQIALLRVLQEREFERVGSNHPISVDVRVIAATNRDLPAAVAAGTFRQDLFFRLNVFPIAVPSLHERVDDIPLLVEYFVGRFAKDVGKNIRHIGKQTLEQLQAYNWPGNIRELQNVVERAVILCETDTFVVDENWLEAQSSDSSPREGLSALGDREVEMIEAALAETHGRISGPTGAAAKLGIPRQTLESKIRRLGINKYGQKRPTT